VAGGLFAALHESVNGANGGIGGVDFVPVHRLARQIAFLSRFSQRHSVRELAAIPA